MRKPYLSFKVFLEPILQIFFRLHSALPGIDYLDGQDASWIPILTMFLTTIAKEIILGLCASCCSFVKEATTDCLSQKLFLKEPLLLPTAIAGIELANENTPLVAGGRAGDGG